MMHILWITETLGHLDGINTRMANTIPELLAAGDEVLLIAPQRPGMPPSFHGAPVIGVPSFPLPFDPTFRVGLPWVTSTAYERVLAFAPEIVHVINPVCVGLFGIRYAQRQRVPLLASYHTSLPAYLHYYALQGLESSFWSYLRYLHHHAWLNLCPLEPIRQQLQERGFEHLHLWRSGVDTTLFSRRHRSLDWRRRVMGGASGEKTLVLSVGRLAAEKNLQSVIAISQRLAGACHFVFVGNGPAATSLCQLAQGRPISFVGPLTGTELAVAYASADLFLFPSLTDTFGNVVLEAMASGLPVVAANAGGQRERLVHGETGVLFDPTSPDALVEALRSLSQERGKRLAMGQAAAQVATRCGWRQTAMDLRRYYLMAKAGNRQALMLAMGETS